MTEIFYLSIAILFIVAMVLMFITYDNLKHTRATNKILVDFLANVIEHEKPINSDKEKNKQEKLVDQSNMVYLKSIFDNCEPYHEGDVCRKGDEELTDVGEETTEDISKEKETKDIGTADPDVPAYKLEPSIEEEIVKNTPESNDNKKEVITKEKKIPPRPSEDRPTLITRTEPYKVDDKGRRIISARDIEKNFFSSKNME